MSPSTFIIAEAGSCHDGEFTRAVELILAAKRAGADACKFQYWSSPERLAARRNAADYLDVYRRYQLPAEWLPTLKAQCDHVGIEFMCTVYLPEDIPAIAPYVKRFKVASFEAGDAEFVAAHMPYGKHVIISTGMTKRGFLGRDVMTRTMEDVDYLHCVSAYPCPEDQANLAVCQNSNFTEVPVSGYSDHTRNILTGAFAVCAGARILEVHFRLDATDPANPDYGTALAPYELREYVNYVRMAERMLGDGVKRPQPAEAPMERYKVSPER